MLLAFGAAPSSFAAFPDYTGELRTLSQPEEPWLVPMRGPLESPFGFRWGRLHAGVDIGLRGRSDVRAAHAGVVTAVGYQPGYEGYGNVVRIRHGRGVTSLYAHLAAWAVSVGRRVRAGQRIATAGCTGSCTGPHLHFEVRIRGRPVDPRRYVANLPR